MISYALLIDIAYYVSIPLAFMLWRYKISVIEKKVRYLAKYRDEDLNAITKLEEEIRRLQGAIVPHKKQSMKRK